MATVRSLMALASALDRWVLRAEKEALLRLESSTSKEDASLASSCIREVSFDDFDGFWIDRISQREPDRLDPYCGGIHQRNPAVLKEASDATAGRQVFPPILGGLPRYRGSSPIPSPERTQPSPISISFIFITPGLSFACVLSRLSTATSRFSAGGRDDEVDNDGCAAVAAVGVDPGARDEIGNLEEPKDVDDFDDALRSTEDSVRGVSPNDRDCSEAVWSRGSVEADWRRNSAMASALQLPFKTMFSTSGRLVC
mmetsp:Transcript_10079/g.28263  ORF Transcript_10079/g.28263 Transcript_10079/m.28263 type:complete len:255 (+) Transcript_10079:1443-2207(+)